MGEYRKTLGSEIDNLENDYKTLKKDVDTFFTNSDIPNYKEIKTKSENAQQNLNKIKEWNDSMSIMILNEIYDIVILVYSTLVYLSRLECRFSL